MVFSILNYNCSNVLDLKPSGLIQVQVKKSFCFQTCTDLNNQVDCSSDRIEQFLPTVVKKNLETKCH